MKEKLYFYTTEKERVYYFAPIDNFMIVTDLFLNPCERAYKWEGAKGEFYTDYKPRIPNGLFFMGYL